MTRYSANKVRIRALLSPSGRALRERLEELGYEGRPINWGHTKFDGVNTPEAIKLSSNKHQALWTMDRAGVPIPKLYAPQDIRIGFIDYPAIGRTSYHSKGSGFWFCENEQEALRAREAGASHFLEYIEGAREFRVHVVAGQSIKISEKHKSYNPETEEFTEDRWTYPERFKRKISLRKIGKEAVEALGLDFGAVDILYKKINDVPRFFVLEVNTAPCLTESEDGDTLERYAQAFNVNF